jgi:hypothetical protein
MKRKIKIGVPQLVNAEFTIDVNGTICRNRIDSKGKIGYYIEDYKKVDYAGLTDAKPVFDAVESLLQDVFVPQVFNNRSLTTGNAMAGYKFLSKRK